MALGERDRKFLCAFLGEVGRAHVELIDRFLTKLAQVVGDGDLLGQSEKDSFHLINLV